MDDITKLHEKQKSSRWWVFTINNPTDSDRKQLDTLCDHVRYLCYGSEIGKKENTPHYQGYAELNSPQRFSWIKKRLTRAYLAVRKGSRTQARDYCFKECNEPFEFGEWKPDNQGKRNELLACKNILDEGGSIDDLWDEHFTTMLRYSRGMREYSLRLAKKQQQNKPIECLWIYGPSGSGKSRYAWENYPDAYRKNNSKWWDGYSGEDVVIWDDYSQTTDVPYQTLLGWIDRYKKSGETKGGTVPLTYSKIIFTCTHQPLYDEQFTRRFRDGVNITPVTSLQNTDL